MLPTSSSHESMNLSFSAALPDFNEEIFSGSLYELPLPSVLFLQEQSKKRQNNAVINARYLFIHTLLTQSYFFYNAEHKAYKILCQ